MKTFHVEPCVRVSIARSQGAWLARVCARPFAERAVASCLDPDPEHAVRTALQRAVEAGLPGVTVGWLSTPARGAAPGKDDPFASSCPRCLAKPMQHCVDPTGKSLLAAHGERVHREKPSRAPRSCEEAGECRRLEIVESIAKKLEARAASFDDPEREPDRRMREIAGCLRYAADIVRERA